MNKSEQINDLALALSRLQGEIADITKDRQGYGYKYADLASVLDVVRPICFKHGLSVTQLCISEGGDKVGVETVLMHASGQWISSTIYMNVQAGRGMTMAQAAGSVITYARRYALAAILGVAQTDNDAHVKNIESVSEVLDDNSEILGKLVAVINDKGLHEKIAVWCDYFKVKSLGELDNANLQKILNKIEGGE